MASLLPHTGILGTRLAKHLLRRASYHVSKARIETFSAYTVDQALSELGTIPAKYLVQPIHYVHLSGNLPGPKPWINDDPLYGAVDTDNGSGTSLLRNYVSSWWLDEARRDTSYRSKMTYFLFTNFTAGNKVLNGILGAYYDYLQLTEFFCLGDWKEYVFQVSKNIIMLDYLNNRLNTKENPNENYARELLELFTIGKGAPAGEGDYTNYTEQDVVEAAKVLTGWRITWANNRGQYRTGAAYGNIPCGFASPYKHDFGQKTFSSRFGNYVIPAWSTAGKTTAESQQRMEDELKEMIDLILSQDETAKFVCRKMYRYFVGRNITAEIENDIIVPLAQTFRANYNLEEPLVELLKSKHFYDLDDTNATDNIVGGMIKSPLDLVLQTLNSINFPVPDPISNGLNHYKKFYYWLVNLGIMDTAGQNIFDPPSVAGFPPTYESPDFDKFWFNSSTIVTRYGMADALLNPNKTMVDFKVSTFVATTVSQPQDAEVLVSELVGLFFPEAITQDRLSYFVDIVLLDDGSLTTAMWTDAWITYANTGNATNIEPPLDDLFRALLWSQEYQSN